LGLAREKTEDTDGDEAVVEGGWRKKGGDFGIKDEEGGEEEEEKEETEIIIPCFVPLI
jgi:hypothetical protein